MRIPPCRICSTAYIQENFGRTDFVVCRDCYDKILKQNKGKYRYAEISIDAYRDTWGATNPNNRLQKKYLKALKRRRAFGISVLWVFFLSISGLILWCSF